MHGESRPVKAGLYGAGGFGSFLARSLAGSQSVRLDAVASRTHARAELLGRDHGVPKVLPSLDALLADESLELMLIATPPGQHARQALDAVRAGKHVSIEKPLATQLGDAAKILDEAAARKLVVGVDYPMLYDPLVEAAGLFNTSRLVGPLLRVAVENIASCSGLGDAHWFWDLSMSGGIFVEHGVHFFDWCGRLAGEAREVAGLAVTRGAREDRVIAAVKYSAGALGSYHHAFVAQPQTERTRAVLSYESVDVVLDGWIPTRLHMSGPAAAVATTTIRRMLRRDVQSVPDARVGFLFDAGPKEALYMECVRAAVEDVARSIRDPSHVARNDGQRAFESLHVAIAARDSARSGTTVHLATPVATRAAHVATDL